jgi:nitrogen fixation-related uncharacterized protein
MFVLSLLVLFVLLVGGWWRRHPRAPRFDDLDRLDEATLRDLGLTHREMARWPSRSCEHLFH